MSMCMYPFEYFISGREPGGAGHGEGHQGNVLPAIVFSEFCASSWAFA